jgi:hypothetical protein
MRSSLTLHSLTKTCDSTSCMLFRVVIRVEEQSESHTFIFARDRLCSKAQYFARAFGSPFIEAQTGTIVFDDISIEDFRHFGDWILTGRSSLLPLDDMVHLYVLVDSFDAKELRITITDTLAVDCFKWSFVVPSTSLITFMHDNVPSSYPLQPLLANAVAKVAYFRHVDLPSPFSDAVTIILMKPYGICHRCYL